MNEQRNSRGQAAKVLVAIVTLAIVLIYAPLAMAGIENVCFGTHRVEDACRKLGVYNALDSIYDNTVFRIFK